MKRAIANFFAEAAVSLQYKNIQLYCLGAVISLFGSMMQESMVAWLAFKLTGSTTTLGSIMFCYMLPMIVASIPGGWVADRFNRRRVVLTTQAVALAIAMTYVIAAASGTLSMPLIYALTVLLGVNVAFEMASRMAMLPALVDRPEHISNAFALDSLVFYACRLLGPGIGSVLLFIANPAWGFAVNAASYVLELYFISRLKPAPAANPIEDRKPAGLREAFAFAYGHPKRRAVMILLSVTTFFGVYLQLMPAFTAVRHGSSLTNGMLIFASELGAVVASLLIARKLGLPSRLPALRRYIGWCGVLFAVSLCLFALSGAWAPGLSLLLMVPVGFAMSAIFSGSQALLQAEVDDRMRGAFTAMFYNFAYFGMLALGGPLLGFLASVFGLTATTCGAAICCLVASFIYLRTDAQ